MLTNNHQQFQIIFSLVTAIIIVFFLVVISGETTYMQSVAAFLAAPQKEDQSYRIEGTVSEFTAAHLTLCEKDACILVNIEHVQNVPTIKSGITLVVFGTWKDSAMIADDLITPCQVH